jgi:putative FmdB family regulatory protein
MPTYEYECQKCEHVFERFQSITEEPLKRCPKCRGKVKRLLGTGAGIIFRGSGFYETDYRSDSYRRSAKTESSSSGSSASSSSSTKAGASEAKSGAGATGKKD